MTTKRKPASRNAMVAELMACAADFRAKVWHGAGPVYDKRTRQYVQTEVFKFYGPTGLIATKHGLDNALRFARKQAENAFNARHQKPLIANPHEHRYANPVPPSSKSLTKQVQSGKSLFKRFTGHDAELAGTIQIPDMPDAVIQIGTVAGIMYDTVRDGVAEKYIHKFHKNSRPLFCVAPDGKMLLLIGGSYSFTERGIVDTDSQGRAIE